MFSNTSLLIWSLGLLLLLLVIGALIGTGNGKPKFSKKRFLSENEARVLTLLETALPRNLKLLRAMLTPLGEISTKRARKFSGLVQDLV